MAFRRLSMRKIKEVLRLCWGNAENSWGQVLNYHFSRDMLSPWHVPCA